MCYVLFTRGDRRGDRSRDRSQRSVDVLLGEGELGIGIGHSPQFSVYVSCGQTAGWIKIPLGTEVGFGRGDIVLDMDPAPPKGAQQPR